MNFTPKDGLIEYSIMVGLKTDQIRIRDQGQRMGTKHCLCRGLRPHIDNTGMACIANPTVNFLSYNPTGLDNVFKTQWTRELMNMFDIDFVSFREHFKKNVGNFLKTISLTFTLTLFPPPVLFSRTKADQRED